jgi:GT2 family glycosyltransferase
VKIFVSIVAHRHHTLLINLGTMRILAEHPMFEVVCRDNVPTAPLKKACNKYGVHYLANKKEQGFASNNNRNFLYCKNELGMSDSDFFVLLNPDIYMLQTDVNNLAEALKRREHAMYVPNLQLDKEGFMQDDNIRRYPRLRHFAQTFLFKKRVTMIDRQNGLESTQNLWASGAFMVIRAGLYQEVKGLDEQFYLYCEDIDMCARLQKHGVNFHYLPQIKPVHLRGLRSRKVLSKHFIWHVSSVIKHRFVPKNVEARRSNLHEQPTKKRWKLRRREARDSV